MTADTQQTSTVCPNCGAQKFGAFCSECGQNDKDYSRSVFRLVADFIGELFEVDSRAVRTLRAMVTQPGKLALEFANNRRANYMTPIRLYLASSIVCFFLLSFRADLSVTVDRSDISPIWKASAQAQVTYKREADFVRNLFNPRIAQMLVYGLEIQGESDIASDLLKTIDTFITTGLDSVDGYEKIALETQIHMLTLSDEDLEYVEQQRGRATHRTYLIMERYFKNSWDQNRLDWILALPEESIRRQIVIDSVDILTAGDRTLNLLEINFVKWLVAVGSRPKEAFDRLVEALPIAMVVLLPLIACCHLAVYARQKVFLSHHLIFSIHLHVVAFIVFAILLAMPRPEIQLEQTLFSISINLISATLILVLFVHTFLAYKRFYQQSVLMTLSKFVFLGCLYLVILVPSVIFVSIYTMA